MGRGWLHRRCQQREARDRKAGRIRRVSGCAVLADTKVGCGGVDNHGQLGDCTMDARDEATPVPGNRATDSACDAR